MELKPCPFCGGEAVVHETEYQSEYCSRKKDIPHLARFIRKTEYNTGSVVYEYRKKAYVPQCTKSDCLGRVYRKFETEEAAIAAWNRRAADD